MAKFRITGPGGDTFEINAPEGATQEQVMAYAQQNFKQPPKGDAANGGKIAAGVTGFNDLPIAAGQLLQNIPGVDKGLNLLRSGIRAGLTGVGAKDTAELFHDVTPQDFNQAVQSREQQYEADKTAAGRDGFDWSRMGGGMVNPMNLLGAGAMKGAKTVAQLAGAGAKAGAGSAALQPITNGGDAFWGDKAFQTAAGAASGAVLTPVIDKAARGVAKAVGAVSQNFRSPQNVSISVNNVFDSQGIKPAEVSEAVMQSVTRQVNEALDAGAKIDPASMVRKAQFEAVGLSGDAAPTVGQLTRDTNPMNFANEKNLSGVRIKTPQGEGNPLSARFQLQNQKLQQVFDNVGASGATDRNTAGQTFIEALRDSDKPVKAAVDQAYSAARDMTGGRAAELERGVFSQAANDALDKGMWGRFIPSEVRGLLNDISEGKTPFTVDAAVQIDGIFSSAQRKAERGGDDAGAKAIGVIRGALHNTPMAKEAPEMAAQAGGHLALPGPAPLIDEGATARAAFDEARKAARSRFATIEQTPALKAALDEAAPDKFVKKYLIDADVRDVQALKNVLSNSPDALGQARAQIADHLKRAAFGENPSGDKVFSADRYLNVIKAIGKQKLETFFKPDEIVRLNLAGKVASDINSIPVGAKFGTNTSGTGAAVMNLLAKLSESPLMRKIPGARSVANQIGEIQTEKAINQALNPALGKIPKELTPEALRRIQLLLPAGAVGAGVFAGSASK